MRILRCLTQKTKILSSLFCLAFFTGAAVCAAPLVFNQPGDPIVSVIMEENPKPDKEGNTLLATVVCDEDSKYSGHAVIDGAGYFMQLHGNVQFIFEYKNGHFKLIKTSHTDDPENEDDALEKAIIENEVQPYTGRYRGKDLVEYCSADKTKYVLFVSGAPEMKKGLKSQAAWYSYTLVYVADGKEQNRFYLPEFNVPYSFLDEYMYCDEKTQILYGGVNVCTADRCESGGTRALDLKTGRITPYFPGQGRADSVGLNEERVMVYFQGEEKNGKFYTYFYSKLLLENQAEQAKKPVLTAKEKE